MLQRTVISALYACRDWKFGLLQICNSPRVLSSFYLGLCNYKSQHYLSFTYYPSSVQQKLS